MSTRLGRHQFRRLLSEESIQYRAHSLADGSVLGRVRSGGTLPDGVIELNGEDVSVHRLLRQSEATIIVVGDAPNEELPTNFGAGKSGFPITVRRLGPGGDAEDRAGRLSGLLGGQGSLILVRPDAVVATVSRSAVDLQDWLDARFGPDRGMKS